tara:strand:+ start:253 stop:516 length:264 start_codon:yes stop_codon:yes gene_type:complete
MSAKIIPQNGPGPMPANSTSFIPLRGPAIYDSCSEKALKNFKRNGSKVNEAKKETNKAKAVNNPNNTVGIKLDRAKIENPDAIVIAV